MFTMNIRLGHSRQLHSRMYDAYRRSSNSEGALNSASRIVTPKSEVRADENQQRSQQNEVKEIEL